MPKKDPYECFDQKPCPRPKDCSVGCRRAADELSREYSEDFSAPMTEKLGPNLAAMFTEYEHIVQVEQVFQIISGDPNVARAWLIGLNPFLDNKSPLKEILAGNGQAVLGAARAYKSGDFA